MTDKPRFVCSEDPCAQTAVASVKCKHPICAATNLIRAAIVLYMSDKRLVLDAYAAQMVVAQVSAKCVQDIMENNVDIVLYDQPEVKASHEGSTTLH